MIRRKMLTRGLGPLLCTCLALGVAGCGAAFVQDTAAIFEVAPDTLHVGETLELRGQGFGETQGEAWVAVAGEAAAIQAWADDRILIEMPAVGPGEVLLLLGWPTAQTNAVSVTVLP